MKTEICISSLKAKKEIILTQVRQRFDDMIGKAEFRKISIDIGNALELETVEEVEELLDNIGIEQDEDNEAVGYEELTRNLDRVNEITGRVAIGTKKCRFLEYNENKSRNSDGDQLFGVLTIKEDTVELGPTGNKSQGSPLGLEKWIVREKSGKITQNTGNLREFQRNVI